MSKKILITGGAGFIGSHLALKLAGKGYTVTVLDNLSHQIHGTDGDSFLFRSIKDKVHFIKGDVRERADWLKALQDQAIVVHLAAETGTGQSMYEIEKYIDVNIRGTAILLDLITGKKCSIRKIVLASSRAIYGEGKYRCPDHGDVFPVHRKESDLLKKDFNVKCPVCSRDVDLLSTDEDSKIHPQSIYGITKETQEQLLSVALNSLKIPYSILRYQNVYGPGQSLSNPYTGILSIFSTRIKNNKDLNIFEDGVESRDFIYIDDVTEATQLAIEKKEADYEIFNVGTGMPVSVLEVAQSLKKVFQSNIKIAISGHFRLGDIKHNYADISRIKEKLKFTPKYDFQTGLMKFSSWVDTQKIQADHYDRSIQEMKEKGLYK
ncbi:MAG: NAD-dependent epimerase/dehydratase family protein [Spirochaetes bacterium]|nr:NAD-dependent epimerase/dehydratase family protein [Spirochaetota bacterium]